MSLTGLVGVGCMTVLHWEFFFFVLEGKLIGKPFLTSEEKIFCNDEVSIFMSLMLLLCLVTLDFVNHVMILWCVNDSC